MWRINVCLEGYDGTKGFITGWTAGTAPEPQKGDVLLTDAGERYVVLRREIRPSGLWVFVART